jgi:prolipoprotein diacylglyceryltransferase
MTIFFLLIFFILIFIIITTIFWIWMIIDVAKRNFKNENDKILWILLVVLLGFIGAIIYYFVIKHPNKK